MATSSTPRARNKSPIAAMPLTSVAPPLRKGARVIDDVYKKVFDSNSGDDDEEDIGEEVVVNSPPIAATEGTITAPEGSNVAPQRLCLILPRLCHESRRIF